jgi:cell division transport system permease protein
MSARAFLNSIREGFQGMLRHPLVTLASVSTILLMLLIMSVFIIFSADARYIMKNVGQQPPIEVFMKLNGTEEERTAVMNYLAGAKEQVLYYEVSSPEQNYNQYKINLGSNASILDDFDYNQYLPYTFRVQLVDPSFAGEVVMRLEAFPGVNKVMQEKQVMIILAKMMDWVNIGTAAAFGVLFLISLFIISNMVRISVYSRATEISIMKYIGATNSYIRLPFIVEGAMVGLVSAVCAWGISYLAYGEIYGRFMAKVAPGSFYSILPMSSLSGVVFLVCAFSGILIGAFGSGVSVRKYIQV